MNHNSDLYLSLVFHMLNNPKVRTELLQKLCSSWWLKVTLPVGRVARLRYLPGRRVGGWWWPHYPVCTTCCWGCHGLQDTPITSAPPPPLPFPPASLAQQGHPCQASPLLHPVWYFLTISVSFQKTQIGHAGVLLTSAPCNCVCTLLFSWVLKLSSRQTKSSLYTFRLCQQLLSWVT